MKKRITIALLSAIIFIIVLLCSYSMWKKNTEKITENDIVKQEENMPQTETQQNKEFYYTPLSDEMIARITGISYPDTAGPLSISYDNLAYVHVLHYDFNFEVKEGELICNQVIAQDLVEIFQELYEQKYPVEKIRLVDEYGADDEQSMEDNNSSCFNYRVIAGTNYLSNHSYGKAIDINPLYNPYVFTDSDGSTVVQPSNGTAYVDRSTDFSYKITHEDLCYRLFIEHGFTWGGDWENTKDYQHFEKE